MIRDTVVVFVARFVSRGASFIVLIILARGLTPSELGYFGFVSTTAYSALYLASAGLRTSSAVFIGKGRAPEGTVVSALLGMWVPLAAIAFGVLWWLFHVYGLRIGLDLRLSAIAGAAVVPMLVWYLAQGVFLGTGAIGSFNLAEVSPRYLMLAVVATLALTNHLTLPGALVAFLAGNVIAAVLSARKVIPSTLGTMRDSLRLAPNLLREGIPFAAVLAAIAVVPSLNIFAASRWLGAASAGTLFSVMRLTDVVGEAATATGLVTFSRGVRSADKASSLRETLRAARAVMAMGGVLGLLIAAFSSTVVRITVGEGYAGAERLLVLFALVLPFLCFGRVVVPGFASQGYVRESLLIEVGGLALNIALIALLTRPYGLQGIVSAMVISRTITACAYAVVAGRIVDSPGLWLMILTPAEMRTLAGNTTRMLRGERKRFLHRLKRVA